LIKESFFGSFEKAITENLNSSSYLLWVSILLENPHPFKTPASPVFLGYQVTDKNVSKSIVGLLIRMPFYKENSPGPHIKKIGGAR
jgi:hypothetical protein